LFSPTEEEQRKTNEIPFQKQKRSYLDSVLAPSVEGERACWQCDRLVSWPPSPKMPIPRSHLMWCGVLLATRHLFTDLTGAISFMQLPPTPGSPDLQASCPFAGSQSVMIPLDEPDAFSLCSNKRTATCLCRSASSSLIWWRIKCLLQLVRCFRSSS